MKKYALMFCLFLAVLALTAFFLRPLRQRPPQDKKPPLTFAFVPGMGDPFYYTMERGIREKAQELGINLIVAEFPKIWGPEIQIPILEAAVACGKIDLLLIAPTSVDALIAPLKKLAAQGMQIITVDTFIGDGDYAKESEYAFPLAYIGTDNELGGKKIAEHLARLLGETGKVYVNTTTPDTSSVVDRVKGFEAGIAEFPNMAVVGVDYNLDVQETARKQTLAMLQKIPEIAGVFGSNTFSAQGSYEAVVAAGLTGAVKIASWDATQDLINALKAGQVDLVLAQKPGEIGMLAVEWGYRFFEEQAQVPKKVIPGFEFFTRENVNDPAMQQFIYQ